MTAASGRGQKRLGFNRPKKILAKHVRVWFPRGQQHLSFRDRRQCPRSENKMRGHKIFLRRWPWSQNFPSPLAVVTKFSSVAGRGHKIFLRRWPWSQNFPSSLAVVTKFSSVAGRGHKIFLRRWPWSRNLGPSLAMVTKSSSVAGRGHKIFFRRWPWSQNLSSSLAVVTKFSSVAGRGHKIFPSLAVVTKSSSVAGRGHQTFFRRWPWSQNLLPSPSGRTAPSTLPLLGTLPMSDARRCC